MNSAVQLPAQSGMLLPPDGGAWGIGLCWRLAKQAVGGGHARRIVGGDAAIRHEERIFKADAQLAALRNRGDQSVIFLGGKGQMAQSGSRPRAAAAAKGGNHAGVVNPAGIMTNDEDTRCLWAGRQL